MKTEYMNDYDNIDKSVEELNTLIKEKFFNLQNEMEDEEFENKDENIVKLTTRKQPVFNTYCLHVALVSRSVDWRGYTTYVFINLEDKNVFTKYIMCVMFPGWDEPEISIGEIGYVNIRFVNEGIDKYFDGKNFVPYRKTDIHFLKFIPENPDCELQYAYEQECLIETDER